MNVSPVSFVLLAAAATLVFAVPRGAQGEDAATPVWNYVAPAAGASARATNATPLGLSPLPPDDIRCEVELRGDEPRYGQIRYGDPDSVRVAFVLDRDAAGNPRLIVDRNRDRVFEEEELLSGSDGEWETELGILTKQDGDDVLLPRRVLFRLGRTGRTLSFATLGFVEGRLALAGETHAVRRIDGNGDGFLTGERDQLWIDLDGNGEWSSLRELHLFAPLVQIAGERYLVRSDRLGTTCALEKIEGTGRIRLALAPNEKIPGERRVTSMHVLLSSRDGVLATVRSVGEPIEVPPGEYRLDMVTLWLADPDGGPGWGFIFSGTGQKWYDVARDEEITIDPVGTPRLGTYRTEADGPVAPGEDVTFRPWFVSEDGLHLNIAFRSDRTARYRREAPGAKLRLLGATGQSLGATLSGFS